jgi:hypothetical protein
VPVPPRSGLQGGERGLLESARRIVLLLSRETRQIGTDQVIDEARGGLSRDHRQLVGGRQRGDAVYARPQHAGRAPALVLAARREMRGKGAFDLRRQALELLLIPGRQLCPRRHVVLEQEVPEAGLLLRER